MKPSEITDYVDSVAKTKQDLHILIKTISYCNGWQFKNPDTSFWKLPMSEWAQTQLLSFLGIPVSYFKKCPTSLAESNANYWVNQYKDKSLLMRMKQNTVIGFVSTRYNTNLDNIHTISFLMNRLNEHIHSCFVQENDDISIFSIINKSYNKYLSLDGVDTDINAGLIISNSEVGRAALTIRPFVTLKMNEKIYNLVDRNGEGRSSIRHNCLMDFSYLSMVIERAENVSQVGIAQVLRMSTLLIDPKRYIEALLRTSSYLPAKKIKDEVLPAFENINRTNRLHVARCVLDVLNDLPLFQKYQAELDVGRSLNLFNSTQARLKSLQISGDFEEDENSEEFQQEKITYGRIKTFQPKQMELLI